MSGLLRKKNRVKADKLATENAHGNQKTRRRSSQVGIKEKSKMHP